MKNNWNYFFLLITLLLFLGACKQEDNRASTNKDYYKGKITILVDDAYKGVTEAIAGAYMINYPEAQVSVEVMKEDLAFLNLLNRQSKLVVMSRELSEAEKTEYNKRVGLEFKPARFAGDAVVFIVPKRSAREHISMEELQLELKSEQKKIIFDGTNAANLNFVAQKLGKKPSELKFSIISGNRALVEQLDEYPDKIGVVSLNTFSRQFSPTETALRERVKILSIVENGKELLPTMEHLRTMNYPFTRVLYMLADEPNFGMANGIMRFACTQKGQIVVQKEGLQPYYLYSRQVEMR